VARAQADPDVDRLKEQIARYSIKAYERGLVGGAITGPDGCDRDFFAQHLATWARRFFVDLERANPAGFYARVGSLGRAFMAIETEAYSFPA